MVDEEEDLVVTYCKQANVMPHARHDCTMQPFQYVRGWALPFRVPFPTLNPFSDGCKQSWIKMWFFSNNPLVFNLAGELRVTLASPSGKMQIFVSSATATSVTNWLLRWGQGTKLRLKMSYWLIIKWVFYWIDRREQTKSFKQLFITQTKTKNYSRLHKVMHRIELPVLKLAKK